MARKSTKKPRAKCLRCEAKANTRGLCRNDYMVLRAAVLRGDTTWEKAERAGLCLKPFEVSTQFVNRFPGLAKKSRITRSA